MLRRPRDIAHLSVAQTMETLRADYSAARESRFRRRRTGLALSGSGADYHYRNESDYLRVIEVARDMDRNDTIVGQTVDRAVDNALSDGIRPDPKTGDPGLDKDLQARWIDWATDEDQCDLGGELTFADMESLCLRHCLVDGDLLVLGSKTGHLKLTEGHRLRTPSNAKTDRANSTALVHGVLLDQMRRHLEYWVTKDDIEPSQAVRRVNEVNRYPVRDEDGYRQAFHVLVSRKRASQTRGVSAFAPIFDTLGMFEDINFAKLLQQQVVSCVAIFQEREIGFDPLGRQQQTGERTTETLSDGSTRTLEGMAPGMRVKGDPGEKFHMDSPNVPNPEFFDHVRLILTLIGINLGMPLVLVLLDASETNFSGFRGAVDQARLGFRRNQQRLIRRFHLPVWRMKVRQWGADDPLIAAAAERLGKDIFRAQFNAPGWPYIEPLKDASADLLRTRNALISQRRRCAERGMDWEDLTSEIVEDNALLITRAHEKAVELNKKYPELNVTWREIASLPTPDGVTVTVGDTEEEEPALAKSSRRAGEAD